MDCEACGATCGSGIASWHFVCPACGTERSTLSVRINEATSARRIDEAQRAEGLAAVRAAAYRTILASLGSLPKVRHGRLLEVGSAHGWFLCAAADGFEKVVGIEPDDAVRARPARANVSVRAGYFPEAVAAGETFDVIVFNDVFEHLPDAGGMAHAVAAHLAPGGIALVCLPLAEGFVYRSSAMLARLGLAEPFKRMWQFGYPSPHLYYFSRQGLITLFANAGLDLERTDPLPTLKVKGLWERIRYGETRFAAAALSYAAAVMLAPVLGVLPADTMAFYFRYAPGEGGPPGPPRSPASVSPPPA